MKVVFTVLIFKKIVILTKNGWSSRDLGLFFIMSYVKFEFRVHYAYTLVLKMQLKF